MNFYIHKLNFQPDQIKKQNVLILKKKPLNLHFRLVLISSKGMNTEVWLRISFWSSCMSSNTCFLGSNLLTMAEGHSSTDYSLESVLSSWS